MLLCLFVQSQCSKSGSLEIGTRFCYPNMELFEYNQFENDAANQFEPQGRCMCVCVDACVHMSVCMCAYWNYPLHCLPIPAPPSTLCPSLYSTPYSLPSLHPPLGAVFLIESQEGLKWLDRIAQHMCVLSESHQLQPLAGMPVVILALGEKFMDGSSAEVQHVTEVANR